MIASALIPSRSKPHSGGKVLEKFFEKFWWTVSNPSDVELIVKVDDEDTVQQDTAYRLQEKYGNTKVVLSPRYDGYHSSDIFWNLMASQAQGTWLGLWPDDQIPTTFGWDKILYDYAQYTTYMLYPEHEGLAGNVGLMIHRELFKLLGTTGNFGADWFWDMAQMTTTTPLRIKVPIVVDGIPFPDDASWITDSGSKVNRNPTYNHADGRRFIQMIEEARRNGAPVCPNPGYDQCRPK